MMNDDDSSSSSSWRVLRYRQRVGTGRRCYEAVREHCLQWEFHDTQQGIRTVKQPLHPKPCPIRHIRYGAGYEVVHSNTADEGPFGNEPSSSSSALGIWAEGRRQLATYTRKGPFCVVNPVRVVYELVDQRAPRTTFTSTAYATLLGHWLRGEERVTVAFRDSSGCVDVEIVSCSKPSSSGIMGRLAWPFVGRLQERFFRSQMEHLSRVAAETPPESIPIQPVMIPQQILNNGILR